MKQIVYFFLLLSELSNHLERYAAIAIEIKCIFLEDYEIALYDARNLPCTHTIPQIIELTLQCKDERLYYVKALELKMNCLRDYVWTIQSPNTFKRFKKLTRIAISGYLHTTIDPVLRKKFLSQLFNVRTITHLEYTSCIWGRFHDNTELVLPPKLSIFHISMCTPIPINWKKVNRLKSLTIIPHSNYSLPELGFPSLQELDLSENDNTQFTFSDIAFYCNLTTFSIFGINLFADDPCNCHMLRMWQQYLKTVNVTLNITILQIKDDIFQCSKCRSYDFNGELEKMKIQRAKCLSLTPPAEEQEITIIPGPHIARWSFWIYMLLAFMIISIIVFLLTLFAQRFSGILFAMKRPQEKEEDEEEKLRNK